MSLNIRIVEFVSAHFLDSHNVTAALFSIPHARQLSRNSPPLMQEWKKFFQGGESSLWPSRESATKLTNGSMNTRASRVVPAKGGKRGLSSHEPPIRKNPGCDPVTVPDLRKFGSIGARSRKGSRPLLCRAMSRIDPPSAFNSSVYSPPQNPGCDNLPSVGLIVYCE